MLTIINEDLMSFEPTFVNDKINHHKYLKLRILTTNRLLQKQSDLGHKDPRSKKNTTRTGENCLVDQADKILAVNREILRISAPSREIESSFKAGLKFASFPIDWKKYPMSVYVTSLSRYSRQVDLRCHETGDDKANIFIIAFPFNGMIKPIKEDPRYRVYKGFISSSIKPFFHANRKYRKVLYLVIEINKNLFKKDHQFHTDNIDISLESYALFTDKYSNERKTNHEKMTLNITSPNGDHSLEWNYEVIDHEIFMNLPNVDLWPTYTFSKDGADSQKSIPQSRNKKKSGQRPMVVEGNTMVTTNKHGIRKEIPLGKERNTRPYYSDRQYSYDKDISQKNETARKNGRGKQNKKGRRK
jgi:hypothetical protein